MYYHHPTKLSDLDFVKSTVTFLLSLFSNEKCVKVQFFFLFVCENQTIINQAQSFIQSECASIKSLVSEYKCSNKKKKRKPIKYGSLQSQCCCYHYTAIKMLIDVE